MLSPVVRGPAIQSGAIPEGGTRVVETDAGVPILLNQIGGKTFFQAEGTFSTRSFASILAPYTNHDRPSRDRALTRELRRVTDRLHREGGALIMSERADVGHFTVYLPYDASDLIASVRKVRFSPGVTVLINPIAHDPDAVKRIRELNPLAEELMPRVGVRRDDFSGFSGLERIGAPEFVRLAEAAIGGGVRVDGSSVNLGITDTGITYNHPTFLDRARTTSRVAYMKDFTREGRVYFSDRARFQVRVPEGGAADELRIDAQIIVTPRIPSVPAADTFVDVTDFAIRVSPELRARLTTPGVPARLGFLTEDSLNSEADPVDLNANGRKDDKLPLILIAAAEPAQDEIYFDPTGTGDFTSVRPMRDFSASGSLVEVFAEKFGFDVRRDRLPLSTGTDVAEVRSASIVGYDPGNHGSHVAGIAGGSRTISNDSDDTLARGVAPQARIQMNRVCANGGGCNATNAFIDLATEAHAEVINMSLGGLSPFNDGYGVQETIINRLTSTKNVLFVISAGNSGPGRQTVGAPSVARLSLSVGATASKGLIQRQYQWPGGGEVVRPEDDTDFMLFFSSRGPTAAGGFKPNLSAPGTELSAIQLNAAPGAHSGLDVFWGTSMSAPTATGAYALLLDAIKKFNERNPTAPLTTDAVILRRVLIDSAKPFDVNRFDPATGAKTSGQYTWMDEGTGIIDLPAAWAMVLALRDAAEPQSTSIDYEIFVAQTNPSGVTYDGTRAAGEGMPAIGTGVYLDFHSSETLRTVHIGRRLPEQLATSPEAGRLSRDLETSAETFELRTVFYGSDKQWLRVGVRDELNCATSPTTDLTVVGRGAEIVVNPDGTGEIAGRNSSTLNVCVDRRMISEDLAPGDHGALIYAHRKSASRVEELPAFIVPVSVTVPHRVLRDSTGYLISDQVRSFGVSRQYVTVPKGTSVVRVTLEVAEVKTDRDGRALPGQTCAGVELMSLEGSNVAKSFRTRKDARITSCDPEGRPSTGKRSLTISRTAPTSGVWDLHVFGSYKFAESAFTLKVDYLTAVPSVDAIEGQIEALNGAITWTVTETSMPATPNSAKSRIELTSLKNFAEGRVENGKWILVESPLGKLRTYPVLTKGVTITTGESPGNDLDLIVIECDKSATSVEDASCSQVGASGGSTDVEDVRFAPREGKVYAARVDGYEVKDEGRFTSEETVDFEPEAGQVAIAPSGANAFLVSHSFTEQQLTASKLANHPLFTAGQYILVGSLAIQASDGTVLGSVPVRIRR